MTTEHEATIFTIWHQVHYPKSEIHYDFGLTDAEAFVLYDAIRDLIATLEDGDGDDHHQNCLTVAHAILTKVNDRLPHATRRALDYKAIWDEVNR